MSNRSTQFTVLHLTDYGAPYEGNFVASLRALEARLAENGNGMVYVFPRRSGDVVWTQEMMRAKPNVTLIQSDGFFAYTWQIRSLLRESGATVLHEHFIHYKQKLAALLAAKTCGHRVKTVLHLHNHIELPKSPLKRLPHLLQFSSISRFVCCSASVAAHLVRDGVPSERVRVAENAIAFERLDRYDPEVRAALSLPENAKLALMFGYNFEIKGVDIAVDAIRSIREVSTDPVYLAIVLSSRQEEVQSRILAQLNVSVLPDWILLLPPREDVASYYHMADVFLSPSRQEGFCYALIEAAYCKTPVLASAIDAQKDLALPQEAFFPPQDAAALCGKLMQVFTALDPALRDCMLAAAQARVMESYSLLRWAEQVFGVYTEIL